RRMDEGIAMMRAVWTQDPVTFNPRTIPAEISEMRILPQPIAPIPIWIGGTADAALKRAVRVADGWQGSRISAEEAAPIVKRLRTERPEPGFTISMRMRWDGKDDGELERGLAAYVAIGVQHVMIEPANRDVDAWDQITAGVGRAAARNR